MSTNLGGFFYRLDVDTKGLILAQLQVNRFYEKVISNNKGMESSFASLTASIAAVTAATFTLAKAVENMDSYKRLQDRIASVSRNIEEYAQNSEQLERISRKLGGSLEAVVKSYVRIAQVKDALGGTNEDVLKLVEAVLGMARAGGSAKHEIVGAMQQLSQGLSNGKFQADELKTLLEALPTFAYHLSKGMGITVGKMQQMRQDGQILSKDVFQAMLKQFDEINERAGILPQRLELATNAFKIDFTRTLAQMDSMLGITDDLTVYIQLLGSAMLTAAEGLAKFVKENESLIKSLTYLTLVMATTATGVYIVDKAITLAKLAIPVLTTAVSGLALQYSLLAAAMLYVAYNVDPLAHKLARFAVEVEARFKRNAVLTAFGPENAKENSIKLVAIEKAKNDHLERLSLEYGRADKQRRKEAGEQSVSEMEGTMKRVQALMDKYKTDWAKTGQPEGEKKKKESRQATINEGYMDLALPDPSDELKQQEYLLNMIEDNELASLTRRLENYSWFSKMKKEYENLEVRSKRQLSDEEETDVHKRNKALLGEASQYSREAFGIYKALAIAEMLITGPKAIADSIAAGSKYGPVVGAAYGALTAAAMGVKAAGILAATYSGPRALGGDVSPGGMYRVNEQGPEVVSFGGSDYLMTGNAGGRVTPNSSLKGGSAPNVTVNLMTDTNQTATVQQRQTSGGFQFDIILKKVEESIANGIRSGKSNTSRAMSDVFGLNRANGVLA